MKLNEISSLKVSGRNKIWLDSVVTGPWFVDADGKISTKGSVFLPKYTRIIPVPFGEVVGNFSIDHPNVLESLQNCPEKVHGFFICTDSRIKTLDHLPSYISGDCNITENKISDLHNIHKRLKHIGGRFYAGSTKHDLKSHVLGLLLLNPYPTNGFWLTGVPEKVNEILNDYIQKGSRDIYAAQEELIDAGLEDFAQL